MFAVVVSVKQRFFKGHKDDIMSMAVFISADPTVGTLVATGQQGKAPTYIWQAPSMALLSSVSTGQKSINMMEFSRDGRLLVSV